MTTLIDAISTSTGIGSLILIVVGIVGIIAYFFKIRNVYVLLLSLLCIAAGGVMLGLATDVIDIVWNGWKTPAPVVPTPDVPTPSG